MRFGVSFRQIMSGSYWRLDTPADVRAIAFAVEASTHDLGSFMRGKTLSLRGEIDAERLASGKPLEGTLSFKLLGERRIAYHLTFSGDDGRDYELSGQEEWSGFSPVESLTLLSASLYERGGEEVGRGTLRFDLRAHWMQWVRSFRLWRVP